MRKLALVLTAFAIMGLAASCVSTGEYMPLSPDETVLGTVQTTFVVRSSLFFLKSAQDSVNTQAYIKLMETAGEKFSGAYDVRDIVWVTGRSIDGETTEISAAGKVVQIK